MLKIKLMQLAHMLLQIQMRWGKKMISLDYLGGHWTWDMWFRRDEQDKKNPEEGDREGRMIEVNMTRGVIMTREATTMKGATMMRGANTKLQLHLYILKKIHIMRPIRLTTKPRIQRTKIKLITIIEVEAEVDMVAQQYRLGLRSNVVVLRKVSYSVPMNLANLATQVFTKPLLQLQSPRGLHLSFSSCCLRVFLSTSVLSSYSIEENMGVWEILKHLIFLCTHLLEEHHINGIYITHILLRGFELRINEIFISTYMTSTHIVSSYSVLAWLLLPLRSLPFPPYLYCASYQSHKTVEVQFSMYNAVQSLSVILLHRQSEPQLVPLKTSQKPTRMQYTML